MKVVDENISTVQHHVRPDGEELGVDQDLRLLITAVRLAGRLAILKTLNWSDEISDNMTVVHVHCKDRHAAS